MFRKHHKYVGALIAGTYTWVNVAAFLTTFEVHNEYTTGIVTSLVLVNCIVIPLGLYLPNHNYCYRVHTGDEFITNNHRIKLLY